MDTRQAAATAQVSIATIRTWCRRNAVTAIKAAGKWEIDEQSLTRRIELGRKHRTAPVLSLETMLAIGGNRWSKAGKDRVYLNDWERFAGIEVEQYGTGNISYAAIGGRRVANSRIGVILGTVRAVYFDLADNTLYVQNSGAREIDVRYRDGQRETLNLVKLIGSGVRAAVAAL